MAPGSLEKSCIVRTTKKPHYTKMHNHIRVRLCIILLDLLQEGRQQSPETVNAQTGVWAYESCGGDKQAIPNPNFDFFEMFLFSLSLT